jgi:hypothetical protein
MFIGQKIWELRTKCSGFTDNIYVSNHKIYCLTETRLSYKVIIFFRPLILYFAPAEAI